MSAVPLLPRHREAVARAQSRDPLLTRLGAWLIGLTMAAPYLIDWLA